MRSLSAISAISCVGVQAVQRSELPLGLKSAPAWRVVCEVVCSYLKVIIIIDFFFMQFNFSPTSKNHYHVPFTFHTNTHFVDEIF